MPASPKPVIAATAFGGFIAGAVTGATLTSVRTLKKIKKGEMTPKQAGKEIIKESGSLGIATSAGVTATALLGITGILSIASVALITAGTKYALDSALTNEKTADSTPRRPADTPSPEPSAKEV